MSVTILCGGSFELTLLFLLMALVLFAVPAIVSLGFGSALIKLIRELLAARR